MKTMIGKSYRIGILLVLVCTFAITAFIIANAKPSQLDSIHPDADDLFLDYSNTLEGKASLLESSYSNEMRALVSERNSYYDEFFAKALHAQLVTLDSEFDTENVVLIEQKGNIYTVRTGEKITATGMPIVSSPNDYPLIQAARWATKQTEDERVKRALEEYIASAAKGGGTKMADTSAPVCFTASSTVLNTGLSRWF